MYLHNGLDIEVYDLRPTDLHYYYYHRENFRNFVTWTEPDKKKTAFFAFLGYIWLLKVNIYRTVSPIFMSSVLVSGAWRCPGCIQVRLYYATTKKSRTLSRQKTVRCHILSADI